MTNSQNPTVNVHIRRGGGTDEVDLNRLTPMARALAECAARALAAGRGTSQVPVIVESGRPVGELINAEQAGMWYTAERLAQPHQIVWDAWSAFPPDSDMDPHQYFEIQARRLPIGYHPVGIAADHRVTADASTDRLVGKAQVMKILREHGRNIAESTWRAYVARRQAPQVVTYIGRQPMWDLGEVTTWAPHRRKPAARPSE